MKTRAHGRAVPRSVDEYLAGVPEPARSALERLRKIIREAAPGAEEVISYQIPSFRFGKMVVGFAAASGHCTFHVMSTGVIKDFAEEIKGFPAGKGSLRFTPDRPLPATLVKRLVKARLAENARGRER